VDDVAKYNEERWKALVKANALFTRPQLQLDLTAAKELVNRNDRLGELSGKKVLCLAGGGGQQSAAFALLGADVTVFDISQEQLTRDQEVANHYQLKIKTVQGDMRNLASLGEDSYDIISHPYSINFVPDLAKVFLEVSRVLKTGGIYQLSFANPFVIGIKQGDWNGQGYILRDAYLNKAEITYDDQEWVYDQSENEKIPPPKEYRHNLGDLMNNLINCGFVLRHISDNESIYPEAEAEPASWNHLVAYAPPWLTIFAIYRPDLKF
jgi:ubiquinone/menaquinone biosynthesis C-methylase UbiE